jgi:hypothetical protein
MQLRYVGATWGDDRDHMRTVGADLCPSGTHYPDLRSWFKTSACVQLDSHLVYEVL